MMDIFYLLTASLKIFCYLIIGIYLLKEWIKLEKKYTSDLPFLMGISVLFLIPGTIIDINVIIFSIEPCFIYNIRYSLDLIAIQLILGAMLSIWMSSKVKIRYTIVISASVLFITVLMLLPSDVIYLDIAAAIITLPTLISMIITFMFTYFTKRLRNVNGLLISIAAIVIIIGSIIRPFLKTIAISPIMPYGLSWFTNLTLIIGWFLMYFGLKLRPSYFKD
ncbi:MAG: hypothetical protein ACTSRP_08665 [Candidatus Helarchaeota archaeon]